MTSLDNIRNISPQDLMALGLQGLAYIRPVKIQSGGVEETVYVVSTADGEEIAVYDEWDVAFAAVRQNGLEPVSVH